MASVAQTPTLSGIQAGLENAGNDLWGQCNMWAYTYIMSHKYAQDFDVLYIA